MDYFYYHQVYYQPQKERGIGPRAFKHVGDSAEDQHGSQAKDQRPHHPQPVHVSYCKLKLTSEMQS